jgi:hypothetical protein
MTTYEPILAELKRVEDEHLLQPGALSILVGRDAYDELVDGIAKSMEPSDELRELAVIAAGGKIAGPRRRGRERREGIPPALRCSVG